MDCVLFQIAEATAKCKKYVLHFAVVSDVKRAMIKTDVETEKYKFKVSL